MAHENCKHFSSSQIFKWLFFSFVALAPKKKHTPFSTNIFTFIGGFSKKKSFPSLVTNFGIVENGIQKNTKTFLFFFPLFVNLKYKLRHISRARLHNDAWIRRTDRIYEYLDDTFHRQTASQIICSFYSVNLPSSYQIQCIGEEMAVYAGPWHKPNQNIDKIK